jgi:hypothetical protein
MEPNGYQKKVLGHLRDFLRLLEAHTPTYNGLRKLDMEIENLNGMM